MVKTLPSHADKAMFVDLLTEGTTPTSLATDVQVRAWVNSLKVPFTTARDPDGSDFAIRTIYGVKETTYIVDRATMIIVAKAKTPEDALTALDALP